MKLTAPFGEGKVQRPGMRERDIALLGALCLFLSALDYVIPKPLPFMRIGLANLPLLLALAFPGNRDKGPANQRPHSFFSTGEFFLLALIKVCGQALITGTLFSYIAIFSLAGTAASALLMFFLRRVLGRRISLIGIGIAGAFASNAAQLVLARFLVFGESALLLTPPFLAAGIVSGAVLGFCAETFAVQSHWLRRRAETGRGGVAVQAAPEPGLPDPKPPRFLFSFRGMALLVMILCFFVTPRLSVRAVLFVVFWLWASITGKKRRPLFTVISFAAIAACNLFPPFGKILFHAGPFLLAERSLLQGIQRAVTMEGLIMFSALIPGANLPLPGKLGRLLRETFGILEELNKADMGKKRKETKPTGFRDRRKSISGKMKALLLDLDAFLCRFYP